jgi:adenylate cyclase
VADVFVSYARADRARVVPLIAALEAEGWSVWWDPAIVPGEEFDRLIAAELKQASVVVVVWTPTSVKSRWVRGEARDGADRGILVPVRFENAELPIDTRALHTIDLDGWDGSPNSRQLEPVVSAVRGIVVRARGVSHDLRPAGAAFASAGAGPATARPSSVHASICVLPFLNMSGDAEQEYFSDGICEDVITDLSKVAALFVVARNTAFTFKGRHVDIVEVARRLGVTHVVEGSVRKASGRVRITAQLIDGHTGGHVWAERYDRNLNDIFALQDEISKAIVSALKLRLLPAERKAIEQRGTTDLRAYDLYLRGRQFLRREKEAELRAAAEIFGEASQVDPLFAKAYAARAQALALMIFRRQQLAKEFLEAAQLACDRALALDPQLPDAWVARGVLHMTTSERDDAKLAFERAIAVDPRSFEAHYFYGRFHVTLGDHAGAVRHYEQAFAIDPTNFLPITLAIQEYQALQDDAGARRAMNRAWTAIEQRLAADPEDSGAYDHGAGVLHLLGRAEESARFGERALALRPDDGATHYNAGCRAALQGDAEHAIALIERAVDLGYGHVDWLLNDNDLVPLHGDPRFKQLLERLRKLQVPAKPADSG